MTPYQKTHLVVSADKGQIIELEIAQQSHDEAASQKWKTQ